MEFLSEHWGGIASVIGVIISVIGLAWAIREARGARSAAQEARAEIGRHLLIVDLERAVALIQRLKLLHRESRWEAALEQYQALRAMTSGIIARGPEIDLARRERLVSARAAIGVMENYVESTGDRGLVDNDKNRLNQELNELQLDLEDIANAMGLGEQTGGN